jgi:hypothetical protein
VYPRDDVSEKRVRDGNGDARTVVAQLIVVHELTAADDNDIVGTHLVLDGVDAVFHFSLPT